MSRLMSIGWLGLLMALSVGLLSGEASAAGRHRCCCRVVYVYVTPAPVAPKPAATPRADLPVTGERYLYPPTTERYYYPSVFQTAEGSDTPRIWAPGDPPPGLTNTFE